MGRLEAKVALVTGAAGGFGEAIARGYAREGAHVVIADIAIDKAEQLAKELTDKSDHVNALAVSFDCTKRADWENGLKATLDKFGKLDIIVNNAGTTYHKKPSTEVTEAEFDKIIAVNTKSIYHSVAVVMPYFVEQKSGVFLSTSSVAGTKVRPGQVFYGGTKGFVNTVSCSQAAPRASSLLIILFRSHRVWQQSMDLLAFESTRYVL